MRTKEWKDSTKDKSRSYRIVRWAAVLLLLVVLGATAAFFFAKKTVVQNQNMEPTLAERDVVWLDRMTYVLGNPARNHVIAYENKDDEVSVSRVIGLPNEEILIKDGLIYVNDSLLTDRLNQQPLLKVQQEEIRFKLDADAYFVLGDNRKETGEVVYANMVHVKKDQILGKVWLRIRPKFSFVSDK